MKKKLLSIFFAILVFAIPVLSIVNGQPLTDVLRDLSAELKMTYEQSAPDQDLFDKDYMAQHDRMIRVITESNELSLLLYTQEPEMTFDLAYALKKVTSAYQDFSRSRRPYDRIVEGVDVEIDRYARLIEALRRLPPIMKMVEIEIVPDSLKYQNDSLEAHMSQIASTLEKEVIRIAVKDSLSSPLVLDAEGEVYRDSCIFYAAQLLKQHAHNRAVVIADSSHYQAAYWRMKEANDYAQTRYEKLEKYVFVDGQASFPDIMAAPGAYWEKVVNDLNGQYNFSELGADDPQPEDSATQETEKVAEELSDDGDIFDGLSSKGANSVLVLVSAIQLIALMIFWVLTYFILWLLRRVKFVQKWLPSRQLPLFCVLLGTFLYFLVLGFSIGSDQNEYIQLSATHLNTFLWLLIIISGSMLLRVKENQIHSSLRLYIPTFVMALVIIVCRICFVPDKLMVFLFPPILALVVLRQLFFCIRESGRATKVDSVLGWVSLAIYITAFCFALFGFTFVALLLLVWWYFQLAVILSVLCILDLMSRYKTRFLNKKVDAMRNRITYVSGTDRESLLFGATWFYEFVQQVLIPALILLSIPMCVHMSLVDVFDFDDLYVKIFYEPFVQLADKDGYETLRISGMSLISLLMLFFILRYVNRAIHAIHRYARYAAFMRKHNRTTIRDNEINLSLGNSLISVLIWMGYVVVVVTVLQIPTGSLSLVAGGLSAGIGLALKDTLNNFIYGIQLMGGRLRVGDWIECDGVRGRVMAINYQCVVVETLEGTEMAFLNSTLFGKNFNNLTRNNSYEFTKVIVGVAYGTDVKKVRDVLGEAMEQLRTKDRYGREIVEPKYGFNVVVNEMSNSSVDIAVKQYVLVAERVGYIDRAKEVIYEALNNAGITIPFPQCDVHLIKDEK